MTEHREPPAGQPPTPAESPQQAVARARENVLRGRGPGAEKSETDRYKRERPTLGPLPAPLERELVHLQTARARSGHARGVDPTAIQNQIDRLHEVWLPKPAEHPRSVAVAHAIAEPTPGAAQGNPEPGRTRYALMAALGAAAGVAATITVQGCRNRPRRGRRHGFGRLDADRSGARRA